MEYVVRLTFHNGSFCSEFYHKADPTIECNPINYRCLAYLFDNIEAAFLFLCFVTKEAAFITDIACYIIQDGQKDFE